MVWATAVCGPAVTPDSKNVMQWGCYRRSFIVFGIHRVGDDLFVVPRVDVPVGIRGMHPADVAKLSTVAGATSA